MASRRRPAGSFDVLAAHRAARDAGSLDTSDKALLFVLLTYVDEHGKCWPSIPTLMRKTALCRNSLRAHRDRLQAFGVLHVEPQLRATLRGLVRPTSTLYRIDLAKLQSLAP